MHLSLKSCDTQYSTSNFPKQIQLVTISTFDLQKEGGWKKPDWLCSPSVKPYLLDFSWQNISRNYQLINFSSQEIQSLQHKQILQHFQS